MDCFNLDRIQDTVYDPTPITKDNNQEKVRNNFHLISADELQSSIHKVLLAWFQKCLAIRRHFSYISIIELNFVFYCLLHSIYFILQYLYWH